MAEPLSTGALFPPWTNTVMRVVLLLALLGVATAIALALLYVRSPLRTGQWQPVVQPIQFDHRHHVADDGIACLYCHSGALRSASAGYPPSEICMGCHNQIWGRSPLIAEVRAKYFANQPLVWKRVNQLPDFVYFNHSIHIARGLDCTTCHGRIDQMAEVMRAETLTMGFCLDCHRQLHARVSCTTCHR